MLILKSGPRSSADVHRWVSLPMPPSTNNLYLNIPRRGRVKSQSYRNYEAAFQYWVIEHGLYVNALREMQHIPYGVELELQYQFKHESLFFKNGKLKKNDLDNRLKALIDCYCKSIGYDDSRIQRITASKHVSDTEHVMLRLTLVDPIR